MVAPLHLNFRSRQQTDASNAEPILFPCFPSSAYVPCGAVGMITSPAQAEHIISTGQADAILMARQFPCEPYGRGAPRRNFANRFHGRCNTSEPLLNGPITAGIQANRLNRQVNRGGVFYRPAIHKRRPGP